MLSLRFMKIKILLLSIIFTVLTAITLSQVVGVNAQNIDQRLITSPVTSPITSPSFAVGGRVQYRLLNFLGKLANILPAKNITVKATNTITKEVKTVKTNAQGHYSINLQKGTYKIQAIDVNNTLFMPKNLTVKLLSNVKGLNFSKDIKASTR